MSNERIREISLELCRLIAAQSLVLHGRAKLTDMGAEEIEIYLQRQYCIYMLSKELNGDWPDCGELASRIEIPIGTSRLVN